MMTQRNVTITPEVIAVAAAANTDGVGLKLIAMTIGCGLDLLKRELRKTGHPGCYTGARMPVGVARELAFKHVPLMQAAAKRSGMPLPRASKRRGAGAYVPLAEAMGIRAYMRPDGVSVPHLTMLYGEALA